MAVPNIRGRLAILRLTPLDVCFADCAPQPTPNGTVDVDDLLAVINVWGQTGVLFEDVTDDGVVNVNDLLAVIKTWDPCDGGIGGGAGPPESQADCEAMCENDGGYTPGTQAFSDYVDRCMEGVN